MSPAQYQLIEYTWAFGRHSNIPECCIEFFVSGEYLEYIKNGYSTLGWRYMPCPKCLGENNQVELHYCTNQCSAFLKSINGSSLFIETLI